MPNTQHESQFQPLEKLAFSFAGWSDIELMDWKWVIPSVLGGVLALLGSELLGWARRSWYDKREKSRTLREFNLLKTQWKIETAPLSSMNAIAMHPAYQRIIGMGWEAVPHILADLQREPGHWFWALKSITGEDPVSPDDRGNLDRMTDSWLRWGRKHRELHDAVSDTVSAVA